MGLILVPSIVTPLIVVGLLFFFFSKQKGKLVGHVKAFEQELQRRKSYLSRVEELLGQLVDLSSVSEVVRELRTVKESLKTERGRNTITMAELETVETRLRELEEIERELEASKVDTNEEMAILEKKQKDLRSKNDSLKQEISIANSQFAQIIQELKMSAEMQEQLQSMQTELMQTQDRIDLLLTQIEEGNRAYFILKQRYDALDIEYAQLYERFSAAEEAAKRG